MPLPASIASSLRASLEDLSLNELQEYLRVLKLKHKNQENQNQVNVVRKSCPSNGYLEKCRTLLGEETVQAALLAAESLSKQAIRLPKLSIDTSLWNSEVASSLPQRRNVGLEQKHDSSVPDEDDFDLVRELKEGIGKGRKRNAAKQDQLSYILGPALERFLVAAAAKEAEEKAAAEQLLKLAAEEEAKAVGDGSNAQGGPVKPRSTTPTTATLPASFNVGRPVSRNASARRRPSLSINTCQSSVDLPGPRVPASVSPGASSGRRGMIGDTSFGRSGRAADTVSPHGGRPSCAGLPYEDSVSQFAAEACSAELAYVAPTPGTFVHDKGVEDIIWDAESPQQASSTGVVASRGPPAGTSVAGMLLARQRMSCTSGGNGDPGVGSNQNPSDADHSPVRCGSWSGATGVAYRRSSAGIDRDDPSGRRPMRMSVSGATLATRAFFGTASRVSVSAAAAAALDVFNTGDMDTPTSMMGLGHSQPGLASSSASRIDLDASTSDEDEQEGLQTSQVNQKRMKRPPGRSFSMSIVTLHSGGDVSTKNASLLGQPTVPEAGNDVESDISNEPRTLRRGLRPQVSFHVSSAVHEANGGSGSNDVQADSGSRNNVDVGQEPISSFTNNKSRFMPGSALSVQLPRRYSVSGVGDSPTKRGIQFTAGRSGFGSSSPKENTAQRVTGKATSYIARNSTLQQRSDTSPGISPVGKQSSFKGCASVGDQAPAAQAEEPACLGVALAFLQTLVGLISSEVGQAAAANMTTHEVVERYIKTRTKVGTRFVDCLPEDVVGQPRYYVSHRWASSFMGLVRSLTKYFNDMPSSNSDRIYVWLDFMACDLHGQVETNITIRELADIHSCASHTLLVLDEDGAALNRTWVLYEIWSVVRNQAPHTAIKLSILADGCLRAAHLFAEMFSNIDVLRSEAIRELDREALFEEMRRNLALRAGKQTVSLHIKAADSILPGTNVQPSSGPSGQGRAASPGQTGGAAGDGGQKPSRKRSHNAAALLHADLKPINQAVTTAIHESCLRDAKKASKMLTTGAASPRSYIQLTIQAAVMYHLSGRAADAHQLITHILKYQLKGQHATTSEWLHAVLALVDTLVSLQRYQEGMHVSRTCFDVCEAVLGRAHKATLHLGLRMWYLLEAAQQNAAAEALAFSLHTRLDHVMPTTGQVKAMFNLPGLKASNTNSTALKATEMNKPTGAFGNLALPASLQPMSPRPANNIEAQRTSRTYTRATDGNAGAKSPRDSTMMGPVMKDVTPGTLLCAAGPNITACFMAVAGQFVLEAYQYEAAAVCLALGRSQMVNGKLTDAYTSLATALSLYQGMPGGSHHPRCVHTLLSLARCAAAMNSHGDAVSWFSQARNLVVRWFSRDSSTWIQSCCDQAASLMAMGDLATAEKMMRRLLAPPLKLRIHVAKDSIASPAAADVPSSEISQDEKDRADDARMGGLSFEVTHRLIEILSMRCVNVPFFPYEPEIPPESPGQSESGTIQPSHQASATRPRTPPRKTASPTMDDTSFVNIMSIVTPPGTPSNMRTRGTEAQRLAHEISTLAIKLLERYRRTITAFKAAQAARKGQAQPQQPVSQAPVNLLKQARNSKHLQHANQGQPSAETAAADQVVGSTAQSRTSPERRNNNRSKLPHLEFPGSARASMVATGATPQIAAPKTANISATALLFSNSALEGGALQGEEGKHQRWKDTLISMISLLNGHSAKLVGGGEIRAAYTLFNAALNLSSDLLGPSHMACVESLVGTVDCLMRLRKFADAQRLLTSFRDHPVMSVGSKEILRIQMEPYLTSHAFKAAETDDPERVHWALDMGGSTHQDDQRLLVVAACLGHVRVMKAIVKIMPGSVYEEETRFGCRALAVAASLGYNEVVEMLLSNSKAVVVDATDHEGRTALWHAASSGQYNCVVKLVTLGNAKVNAGTLKRSTPLMAAAAAGYLPVLQFLLERKADLDVTSSSQQTALIMAAARGHAEALELLLRCHARANVQDQDGSTALMLACNSGCRDAVRVLLSYRCELDIRDLSGQTALFKACHQGDIQLVEMLLLSGAEPALIDVEGRNCLHVAAQEGHTPIIAFMLTFLVRGGDRKAAVRIATATTHLDIDVNSVPTHIRYKVDQVLAARFQEMSVLLGAPQQPPQDAALAPAAAAQRGQSPAENHTPDETMRDLVAGARARIASVNKEQLQSMYGRRGVGSVSLLVKSSPSTSVHTADAGLPAGLHNTAPDPSIDSSYGHGRIQTPVSGAPFPSDGDKTDSRAGSTTPGEKDYVDHIHELRLLLAHADVPQVWRMCSCQDKYGMTPADVASEAGHHQLGRLLRLFKDTAAPPKTSTQASDVDAAPTAAVDHGEQQGFEDEDDDVMVSGSSLMASKASAISRSSPSRSAMSVRGQLGAVSQIGLPPAFEAVLLGQDGDVASRRIDEELSGSAVRKRVLMMDAEYDD